MTSTDTSDFSRAARANSRGEVREHEPRVRQARQRIGQRVVLRLLEDQRVADDAGCLLGHAIEQPAVILGERRGARRVHRQRAHQPIANGQRAHQRADASVVVVRDARGLEIGRGPCVQERAAVRAHPSDDALALPDHERPQQLGVHSRRKAAPERLAVGVVEEERARRERHDVAQLRRDERHRVRDAEPRAHRLGDVVERVDLAVRVRDLLEHRRLCRRLVAAARRAPGPSRPRTRTAASVRACARRRPAAAAASSTKSVDHRGIERRRRLAADRLPRPRRH